LSMRGYLEAVRAGGKKKIFLADYGDTHDILACIDALVSPLSTIILEAALHGKPVLCLMATAKGGSLDLQKRMVHFDDLYNCSAVLMANGENALVPKLNELLAHVGDEAFAADLRAACRHFVADFDKPFSERIIDALERIVGEARA
jgi:CDP-glycerol glycerophosphotransferase (TagB/SpsB family)